jgi:2-polyprenyl-3-methyl-5-hydroxy-6-metoxy-1,4-benzoquinol methylase
MTDAHTHLPDDAAKQLSTSQWDAVYHGAPRWDIGRPQPAFGRLAESGAIHGRVLDVGCGTGEHVLMCTDLGLDATGVDVSAAALQVAADKAQARGLPARFVQLDVRRLTELEETFDTVLDSGLFVHLYDDEGDRAGYLNMLWEVVNPGGRYFILCFRSQAGATGHGHHRGLSLEELTNAFSDRWRVDSIEPTTLDSAADPDGIPAWLVALSRS